MSPTTKRLTVDQYDQMVENGILPQTNRLELIEGRIVEKARQSPPQAFSSESCRDALAGLVPTGWHVRCGNPVRVPARDSEPEPDVSVVRGQIRDYCDHHPGPEDVALVVEVVRWDVAEERRLAATYGGGGIPVYWIVNVAGRQLEVYAHPSPSGAQGARAGGAYPAPTILGEPESVDLIIQGQVVGEIAVADLLPQVKGGWEMSIATKAPVSETRIGFTGVGFDVYERLIRATPARTAVRMAYDGRNLEIMVTGPVHDDYGWFLDRFINVVARVVGVRRRALGKTTWIRPEIERGIEADQCYVFDPAKVSAVSELLARKENDVALYPNPDLAVDVDISRPQTDRPAIYAALEVPELWTFDSERVTIAQLSGGQYVDTGRSRWIPVTASDATRWLVSEDTRDMDAWEERVRAWAELLPRAEGGGT